MAQITRTKLQTLIDADKGTPYETSLYRAIEDWHALGADRLPVGLDYFLYRCSVCTNISTCTRWLQQYVGSPLTGRLDASTQKRIRDYEAHELIEATEQIWRRRTRSEVDRRVKRVLTNHITAVKKRALKLMKELELDAAASNV